MSEGVWRARCAPNLLPLSVSQDFAEALHEWAWTGASVDHGAADEVCQLCTHEHLRYHFTIRNRHTSKTLEVGSTCIERFEIEGWEGVLVEYRRMQTEARNKARQEAAVEALRRLYVAEKTLGRRGSKDTVVAFGLRMKQEPKLGLHELRWLASRLSKLEIPHDPQDFTVSLRERYDRDCIVRMSPDEYALIRRYLAPEQARRMDERRPTGR